MSKKLIWASVGMAVVVLIIVGAVFGLRAIGQKSAEGHITVTEAKADTASLQGQNIRIAGFVVPGSLSWNPSTGVTGFTLADSSSNITVTYRGVMPSGFKPGGRLAVDGTLTLDGKFQASDIPSNALCNVCHS